MNNFKEKTKKFIDWIKEECKDWRTFVIFAIVVAVMYFPTWGGYLLYLIFNWNWCLIVATTSLLFWAGPFTPFFPLCIAITLGIKRLLDLNKKNIDTKN